MTALSVIVPTLDRRTALERTLRGFLAQQTTVDWELVVVDNGSSDGSPALVRALARETAVPLRLLEEPRAGVPSTRNAGIRAARGELVLLVNDDTRPARPDLLDGHLAAHARLGTTGAIGGRIEYEPEQEARPFMHWLNQGAQFAYGRMRPGPIDPHHLYTAHASLPRELLLDIAFDERLVFGFEDAALGVALSTAGRPIHYAPELLTLHDHPITLPGWRSRMERMGAAGHHANARIPVDPPIAPRPDGLRWSLLAALAPVLARDRVERSLSGRPARLTYQAVNAGAYATGYRRAARSADAPPPG